MNNASKISSLLDRIKDVIRAAAATIEEESRDGGTGNLCLRVRMATSSLITVAVTETFLEGDEDQDTDARLAELSSYLVSPTPPKGLIVKTDKVDPE